MNVDEALKALASYPIPRTFILNVLADLELDPNATANTLIRKSAQFKRAKIAVYRFLITAPNITQNGISYSLTAEDKNYYKQCVGELEREIGSESSRIYGYVGDDN